jgi:hypothetical protein
VAARADAELEDFRNRLHADGAVEELAVAVEAARYWERFRPE